MLDESILQRKSVINEITGQLEIPNGNNPFQNAWLTLTLGYDLLFLDSRVHGTVTGDRFSGNIIIRHKDLGWCARDSDDFLFPILDRGYDSILRFIR